MRSLIHRIFDCDTVTPELVEVAQNARPAPTTPDSLTTTRGHQASVHLSRISRRNVSPQDAQQVLTAAFTTDDYIDCTRNLTGWNIDPQEYVDGLDQVDFRLSMLTRSTLTTFPYQIIDTLTPRSEIYNRSLRALRKTCGIYGILPSSHLMSQGLTLGTADTMKRPFASGGFADVWKARNDNGQIFAVKTFRVYEEDIPTLVRKVLRVCHSVYQYLSLEHRPQVYCKAVVICRRMRHKNVLSVEGVAPGLFEFCLLSKWMDNGNLLDYVRTHGQFDRLSLVSSPAFRQDIDSSSSPMLSYLASHVASTISTPMR